MPPNPLRLAGLRMSFGRWLMVISLLSLLPLLLFTLAVVQQLLQARQAQQLESLQRRAAVAADAIGREVEGAHTTAKILVLTREALRGDFVGLHHLAQQVVQADASLSSVSLVRADGTYVFSSRRPWGDVPAAAALHPVELRMLAGNAALLSPLVPLGRDGGLVLGLALPLQPEGGPRHSLRIALEPGSLSRVLRSQRWPADWTATLVDQKHRIVARTRDEARYFGQTVAPTLQAALERRASGSFRADSVDGQRVVSAVAAVPGTPWWLAVSLPARALDQDARNPLLWVGAVGTLLAASGMGAAWALGIRLVRQVRRAARGEDGPSLAVLELNEMELQRRRREQDLHDARHDALTGLPARALFEQQAQALQVDAAARGGWGLALLYVDLDGFKQVNDRFGHDAGDRVLVRVADTLRRHTRIGDCCARLGGDEFGLLLAGPLDSVAGTGASVAARIVDDIGAIDNGMGCSVGVATGSTQVSRAELQVAADRAMRRAKAAGKNRVEVDVVPAATD